MDMELKDNSVIAIHPLPEGRGLLVTEDKMDCFGAQPIIRYDKNSSHQRITVVDRGNVRRLICGSGWFREQSAINLNNPIFSVYGYTSLMVSSLLFVEKPTKIFIAGLGAGIIPRLIKFFMAGVHIDIAEIDPDIVSVAKEYFFFEEEDRMKIIVGDAREIVQNFPKNNQYDVVILDAYSTDYIPFHLSTKEFFVELSRIAKPNGVIASNFMRTHEHYPSHLATIKSSLNWRLYKHLDVLTKHGNEIVYASNSNCVNPKLKDMLYTPYPFADDEIKEAKILLDEQQNYV